MKYAALFRGAITCGVELYFAYAVWRMIDPDAPELGELARSAWAKLDEQARYREAIRRTLSSIRNLPETEPEA